VTLRHHGCKPSDPAKIAASPKAHEHPPIAERLGAPATLPLATNNIAKLVARKNQGASEACTAHSLSALISTVCALAGVPCVEPSEHVLYTRSGRIEVGPDGELQDDGRQMLDVWKAFLNDGLAPQGTSPDGRNSDVWTQADLEAAGLSGPAPNVCETISAEHLAEAHKCRPALTLFPIDAIAADVELQVKSVLAVGHLVWDGGYVGSAYQALTAGQIAQPDPPGDPTAAGHAEFYLDYRTQPDGSVEYLKVNSWGDSWGTNGMTWCSAAELRAQFELHAIGVAAPAPAVKTILQEVVDDLKGVVASAEKAVG
jgi:hypothetical protein